MTTPTPPADAPTPRTDEAEKLLGNLMSIFAYDDQLKKMSAKELVLEVLGSTAADYRCVNELMNRVLPNYSDVLTDAETEAATTKSPEQFEPLRLTRSDVERELAAKDARIAALEKERDELLEGIKELFAITDGIKHGFDKLCESEREGAK